MKQKLAHLLGNNVLDDRPIFLFGNTEYTYEALKIFANNQRSVTGIIASEQEVKQLKNLYGIDLYIYEKVRLLYENKINILISVREYKTFCQLLFDDGFQINKNLFVDYGILDGFELLRYQVIEWKCFLRNIKNKWNKVVNKKIHILMNYLNEYYYIRRGMQIYNRIQKEYQSTIPILVYDYSGLGDVFVFCGLLAHNSEKIVGKEYILTVIGGSSKKVAKMFNINNVCALTNEESIYLSHFAKFLGDKYCIKSITPFSRVMYAECISPSLAGSKINMLDMYKYVFFELDKSDTFQYPFICMEEEVIDKLFKDYGLEPYNTVILSPYANTIVGYPIDFWIDLSEKLKEKGYCVCTNCGGNEKEIPGTIRFSFGLEIAEKVLDYAGYFIALRNGFCEIVCHSTAKKILIYPIYDIFNSNVYDFCSLKKMGIGRNYIEIKWKYSNYKKLEEKMLTIL